MIKTSEKSYIKYLESELIAQRQANELLKEKEKKSSEYDKKKRESVKSDGITLANIRTHVMNYENGVFGAEVTLDKIIKAVCAQQLD